MIEYREALEGIAPDLLAGFWDGWPAAPSPEAHLRLLAGSEAVILAIDPAAGGRVVGFVTAVGDGVLAAYIPFLEVLPAYRGQGIGSELVRRLLARLRDRYMVDLVCDEDLVPFYERFGMVRYGAMILRRHRALEAIGQRSDRAGPAGRAAQPASGRCGTRDSTGRARTDAFSVEGDRSDPRNAWGPSPLAGSAVPA